MESKGNAISKEGRREIRTDFFRHLAQFGVSKTGLEDIWNYLDPPKKRPIGASQIAMNCLNQFDYNSELAVEKVILDLEGLRKVFSIENEEWERFVLHISQGFSKYNKKIRAEFLSLLGSQSMRELFIEDYQKFSHNKKLLIDKYSEAYGSWYRSYQASLREGMDKNLFWADLARPLNTYHVNSLPLEFVHPRDLVELELPEPKKNRGYRFPLSGF